MKESPAPTVSTTRAAPVGWVRDASSERTRKATPSAPRVTTVIAAPRPTQRAMTSSADCPAYSSSRSSALALTRSLSATSSSTRSRTASRSPMMPGRTLGS